MGKEEKGQSWDGDSVGWAHLHSMLWDIRYVIHRRVRTYIKRNVIHMTSVGKLKHARIFYDSPHLLECKPKQNLQEQVETSYRGELHLTFLWIICFFQRLDHYWNKWAANRRKPFQLETEKFPQWLRPLACLIQYPSGDASKSFFRSCYEPVIDGYVRIYLVRAVPL